GPPRRRRPRHEAGAATGSPQSGRTGARARGAPLTTGGTSRPSSSSDPWREGFAPACRFKGNAVKITRVNAIPLNVPLKFRAGDVQRETSLSACYVEVETASGLVGHGLTAIT